MPSWLGIGSRARTSYPPPAHGPAVLPAGLTAREREVLRLAADGLRTRDMAASLYVGERTIKAHLASIYLKLEVGTRAAAIARATVAEQLTVDRMPR